MAGWSKAGKRRFAAERGISQAQISAVIAWTHKNLGGKRYLKRHLGTAKKGE